MPLQKYHCRKGKTNKPDYFKAFASGGNSRAKSQKSRCFETGTVTPYGEGGAFQPVKRLQWLLLYRTGFILKFRRGFSTILLLSVCVHACVYAQGISYLKKKRQVINFSSLQSTP